MAPGTVVTPAHYLALVREAVAADKLKRPPADVRRMAADAPPPRDFYGALADSFGLIAEIKERSPSVGPMRAETLREAASAYAESSPMRSPRPR